MHCVSWPPVAVWPPKRRFRPLLRWLRGPMLHSHAGWRSWASCAMTGRACAGGRDKAACTFWLPRCPRGSSLRSALRRWPSCMRAYRAWRLPLTRVAARLVSGAAGKRWPMFSRRRCWSWSSPPPKCTACTTTHARHERQAGLARRGMPVAPRDSRLALLPRSSLLHSCHTRCAADAVEPHRCSSAR